MFRIKKFPGDAEFSLSADIELSASVSVRKAWSRPPISMQFTVSLHQNCSVTEQEKLLYSPVIIFAALPFFPLSPPSSSFVFFLLPTSISVFPLSFCLMCFLSFMCYSVSSAPLLSSLAVIQSFLHSDFLSFSHTHAHTYNMFLELFFFFLVTCVDVSECCFRSKAWR